MGTLLRTKHTMRLSKYLLATIKESPADAEIISHKLMLRAGLIRKLASGLYSWLPLGNKVLRKITSIVREEMDKSGAMEVSMPIVQPAELWQESKRWSQMGPELLRIQDRHKRDFCLGPTHEEVITDLVRTDYSSYKQLPAILYQIQTKFRDERRPRFGVMRSREFIMKDAYSFHINQESLDESYKIMHTTYSNIFKRLGLNFRSVTADSGSIGGSISHEFHALADSGEDEIVFSKDGKYAANAELARGNLRIPNQKEEEIDYQLVDTGTAVTIEEITNLLKVETNKTVKTLLVHSEDEDGNVSDKLVALLLRGDQELNITKTEKLKGIFMSVTLEDLNRPSYQLSSKCSEAANLVRAALVSKGLETPTIDNGLCRDEKYDKIKASMTDVVEALGLDLNDDSLSGTPYLSLIHI